MGQSQKVFEADTQLPVSLLSCPLKVRQRLAAQKLMALPKEAAKLASLNASDTVGWAWQTLATSSQEAPYSMAKAASLIISPAPDPRM